MKEINCYLKDSKFENCINLYDQIVRNTPAKNDQEHLPAVCIAKKEIDTKLLQKIRYSGVDFIAATRDFSKNELEHIKEATGLPVLNLESAIKINVSGSFEDMLAKLVVKYAEENYRPPWL